MGDNRRGVRVPLELHAIAARPLEEYVRARILQFATMFTDATNPSMPLSMAQQAAAEAIAQLPPPEYGPPALECQDLQLVFRHDCLSLGCLDPQCMLCEHNPHRRCNVNFAPKYLVSDLLKAKCEAPIRVEIIDRSTGVPLGDGITDVHLEMCILDGNAYDAKCMDGCPDRGRDLASCSLLLNNKQTPLLASGAPGVHTQEHRVVVQLLRGSAQLPDLAVSDSSEAMLSGRKPPFRLLVRAVHDPSRRIAIRHAVSEGFVVATRRTRTAGKVEIPNVDDHVSKLEHMGKETVKKLSDVHASAVGCSIDISVPNNCISKVGDFRKLALLAEGDGHLRQKLQQVLKLSKEKWDEARDHAMRAVVADNRMRIWYADKGTMEVGLLFVCRLGNVDLDRPVGLLQKKSQDGTQTTMEATLLAQQTPQQREQVRLLQPQAVAAWWQAGHPGWAIYPVDSEHFMSTGALDSVSLAQEGLGSPTDTAAGCLGSLPFGSNSRGMLPSTPPPLMGGPLLPSIPSDLASIMGPGRLDSLGSRLDSPGLAMALANGSGRGNSAMTPGRSGELGSLGSLYRSGSMGSGALNLAGFPSTDLEQLVAHLPNEPQGSDLKGQYSMGSLPSMGLGSLDSFGDKALGASGPEAAAAMLHDLPEQQAGGDIATAASVSTLESTSANESLRPRSPLATVLPSGVYGSGDVQHSAAMP